MSSICGVVLFLDPHDQVRLTRYPQPHDQLRQRGNGDDTEKIHSFVALEVSGKLKGELFDCRTF